MKLNYREGFFKSLLILCYTITTNVHSFDTYAKYLAAHPQLLFDALTIMLPAYRQQPITPQKLFKLLKTNDPKILKAWNLWIKNPLSSGIITKQDLYNQLFLSSMENRLTILTIFLGSLYLPHCKVQNPDLELTPLCCFKGPYTGVTKTYTRTLQQKDYCTTIHSLFCTLQKHISALAYIEINFDTFTLNIQVNPSMPDIKLP